MKLTNTLRQVSFIHLIGLMGLAFKNPLFIIPTIRATRKTVALSYKLYDKAHQVNGPANAFRHALWNYLIARHCSRWSKKMAGLLTWTKDITDWHEQAFQNSELAEKMDLHNNAIGRELYEIHPNLEDDALMKIMKKMTKDSILVTSTNELQKVQGNLAHIIP